MAPLAFGQQYILKGDLNSSSSPLPHALKIASTPFTQQKAVRLLSIAM